MWQDFRLFRLLSFNNKGGVPRTAIYTQGLLTCIFIVTSTFESILIFSGFILGLSSLATVLGVFVLGFISYLVTERLSLKRLKDEHSIQEPWSTSIHWRSKTVRSIVDKFLVNAALKSVVDVARFEDDALGLSSAVENAIECYGRCLIIDCHSYPQTALPYEASSDADRPDICIGTDEYHTPKQLADWLVNAFARSGRSVSLNSPFSGSLVAQGYYHLDKRVESVMIEVRRDTYMNEHTGVRIPGTFEATQEKIRVAVAGYCGIFESKGSLDVWKSNV